MVRLVNPRGLPVNPMGSISKSINVNSRNRTSGKIQIEHLARKPSPKIAVLRRLGGIGDVLMTTPLLTTIKKLIPHCHLIYATDLVYSNGALGDIIRHNPYVDELISVKDIRHSEYDYWVDITSTGLLKERPGTTPPNRIFLFAEEAGLSIEANPVPVYLIEEDERKAALEEIKQNYLLGAKREDIRIIAIQSRSNDARRTWPLTYVQALANKLQRHEDFRVLLFDWGHTVDTWTGDERLFVLKDKPFVETMALLEHVDLVVSPDSSMLHMAGTLNKKAIGIFGPIPPESRINYYANTEAATMPPTAVPCPYFDCWYNPKCAKGLKESDKLRCLTEITPNQVYHHVLSKLESPQLDILPTPLIKRQQIQKILIKIASNHAGIGDILTASTGLEGLKIKYPNSIIDVTCDANLHDILEYNPNINKLYLPNVLSKSDLVAYNTIFDLSNCCATYEYRKVSSHLPVTRTRVEIYAETMGVRNLIKNIKPRYYIRPEEIAYIRKCYFRKKYDKSIYLALESAELYRSYPEFYWQELINLLAKNSRVFLSGSVGSTSYKNCIDIQGIDIRQAFAILSQCNLALSADTGPMHAAAAMDIPIVAIMGPIDYRSRCKGYDNVVVALADLDCSPCWRNKHIPCKKTGSTTEYSECLVAIKPTQLAKIVQSKLKELS